nr:immunoglobulin light chain junction region [Macaca mulatta]
CQQYFRFPYTF